MLKIITTLVLALSLQSCLLVMGAAAGAVVVTGIVYDKRTAKATEEDKVITREIQGKLNNIPEVRDQSHIIISTFNRVVLVAGQVPNQAIKDEVVAISQTVPGIDSIYNELTIKGKTSTLSNTSDTWINAKVKTKLAAENGLESSAIQVVTVDGAVYLMGIVSRDQGDIATTVAQQITGVQKVVKIFIYDDPT